MSPEQEATLMKIARTVANRSRLEDKEEALSVALLGIVKGLNTYDPSKGVKLTTYLYSCAKFEVWAEWRKLNRLKRGKNVTILSIEQLREQGVDI